MKTKVSDMLGADSKVCCPECDAGPDEACAGLPPEAVHFRRRLLRLLLDASPESRDSVRLAAPALYEDLARYIN